MPAGLINNQRTLPHTQRLRFSPLALRNEIFPNERKQQESLKPELPGNEAKRSRRYAQADLFLSRFLDLEETTMVIKSEDLKTLEATSGKTKAAVLLPLINDIRYINRFFRAVSFKLEEGGLFSGSFETYTARNKKISERRLGVFAIFFRIWDFLFHRVCPKTPILNDFYFLITKGRNRMLSKAEVLGRLVYCGFELLEYEEIEERIFFVVKKGIPRIPKSKPSYGLIYGMPRIGKNGKVFLVYKFRTMHPYSEFLHDYVLNKNGYSKTGKPANDFRLTPWGRFLRKYWLDEIPQLFNILKGDMKLVGIRPVGERYMQDIPEDLISLRIKHKPGCIPPYVSLDMNSDVSSVQEAERSYLIEKSRRPYTTDLRYFFKAIYVILVRKKRSA